jgi:hypothetical protein
MASNGYDSGIASELTPDERLLWSGRPRQGICFRATDFYMIPFSLLWAGFAFFWEASVISIQKAPIFFSLWGIPFVLAGIYIVFGRFFLDSYQRGRTYYGLTDRRIIIVSGLINRDLKTIAIQNLAEVSLQEKRDGSGAIFFGPVNPIYAMFAGTSWPGMRGRMPPSFDLIPEVRKVYNLVQSAQSSALPKRS